MHVLYLHQYFTWPGGNGGTRSYEFARRLVARGHRVTVVTSDAFLPAEARRDATRWAFEHEGIAVKVLKVPYGNEFSYARRMRAFAAFSLAAAREAAALDDVDVVFATSTPLTIALPGLLARAVHRAPMVFEVRDLWPELPIAMGALRQPVLRWAAKTLERIAYRASDHVIALSPGMRDGVVRAGGRLQDTSVIPNGCDVELFSTPRAEVDAFLGRHPELAGGPLVVYAGTMGRINGVSYLVELAEAARTRAPQLRFAIVGAGAEAAEIRALATSRGVLDHNLWMLGERPKTEVRAVLAAATMATSLFIDLPAMWNNSANKFFDALAAGKPIAINYGGWQADLLRTTGAGLVLPPRDPAQAATELADTLADRDRLAGAAAAARSLAEGTFARDRLADAFIARLEATHAQARQEAA